MQGNGAKQNPIRITEGKQVQNVSLPSVRRKNENDVFEINYFVYSAILVIAT